MKKNIFIIALLLCSINTFSQSVKTPIIPVDVILKGFSNVNTLRAKLLELGFIFDDEKKSNEESWKLYLNKDEKTNDYFDSNPSIKKITPKVLCDILTVNNEVRSVFIHIRKDLLPYYQSEMQQNIKTYFPYTRAISISSGYGTASQKDNFELQYYSNKNSILVNVMNMDEQWVIIRFALKT